MMDIQGKVPVWAARIVYPLDNVETWFTYYKRTFCLTIYLCDSCMEASLSYHGFTSTRNTHNTANIDEYLIIHTKPTTNVFQPFQLFIVKRITSARSRRTFTWTKLVRFIFTSFHAVCRGSVWGIRSCRNTQWNKQDAYRILPREWALCWIECRLGKI